MNFVNVVLQYCPPGCQVTFALYTCARFIVNEEFFRARRPAKAETAVARPCEQPPRSGDGGGAKSQKGTDAAGTRGSPKVQSAGKSNTGSTSPGLDASLCPGGGSPSSNPPDEGAELPAVAGPHEPGRNLEEKEARDTHNPSRAGASGTRMRNNTAWKPPRKDRGSEAGRADGAGRPQGHSIGSTKTNGDRSNRVCLQIKRADKKNPSGRKHADSRSAKASRQAAGGGVKSSRFKNSSRKLTSTGISEARSGELRLNFDQTLVDLSEREGTSKHYTTETVGEWLLRRNGYENTCRKKDARPS